MISRETGGFALDRRRVLKLGAGGATALAVSGTLVPRAAFAADAVRWVSPRGTIEVLDDYPYWVALRYGYFGDIETSLEPGPSDATATVKLVDQGQADMGYPSPGVLTLGLAQGIPLVSVFHMGGADVFDFAFRKGEKPADIRELEGKTVLLGSAGWQAICDPMLHAAGVDVSKVNYVAAGWPQWGTTLAQGQGDAALAWAGLRAQWKGQGLDFDYIIGKDFSQLPANSFVIRKGDYDDMSKRDLYARYLRGWAMGLEFGRENPRAATQIVMEQFPGLSSQMTPSVATESMMQLAAVFEGRWDERGMWGFHLRSSWQQFFDAGREIGQIQADINLDDVISNELVPGANDFDVGQVHAEAAGFELAADYDAVDVAAIAETL